MKKALHKKNSTPQGRTRFFVFVGGFVFASLSHATPISLKDLLKKEDRPTVLEAAALGLTYQDPLNGPPINPNKRNQTRWTTDKWIDVAFEEAAKLIASLEKAFPNGKYAFMGRDAQLLADLVETFYLSIGQKDRVVRIGVSKASFLKEDGVTPIEDEKIFKLLQTQGLDLNEVLTHERPFVFVDTVSSGAGRQGRSFLSLIYREIQKAKADFNPKFLLKKLNMVGLVVSTFKGTEIPIESAEAAFETQLKTLEQYNKNFDSFWGSPHLLTFRTKNKYAFEFGYEHHAFAWNQSFGVLEEGPDGKVRARTGDPFSEKDRAGHLAFQHRVIDRARNKAFFDQVVAEAAKQSLKLNASWRDILSQDEKEETAQVAHLLETNQLDQNGEQIEKLIKHHREEIDSRSSTSENFDIREKPLGTAQEVLAKFGNWPFSMDLIPKPYQVPQRENAFKTTQEHALKNPLNQVNPYARALNVNYLNPEGQKLAMEWDRWYPEFCQVYTLQLAFSAPSFMANLDEIRKDPAFRLQLATKIRIRPGYFFDLLGEPTPDHFTLKDSPKILSEDLLKNHIQKSLKSNLSTENTAALLFTLLQFHKEGRITEADLASCLEQLLPYVRPTFHSMKALMENTPDLLKKEAKAFEKFQRYARILKLR